MNHQEYEQLMKERGGIYLKEKLGVNEWAFGREDALKVLEDMKEQNFSCSGGDVIVEDKEGKLKYTNNNWYYQRGDDTQENYIENSIAKATDYIKNYQEEMGKKYYYVLV